MDHQRRWKDARLHNITSSTIRRSKKSNFKFRDVCLRISRIFWYEKRDEGPFVPTLRYKHPLRVIPSARPVVKRTTYSSWMWKLISTYQMHEVAPMTHLCDVRYTVEQFLQWPSPKASRSGRKKLREWYPQLRRKLGCKSTYPSPGKRNLRWKRNPKPIADVPPRLSLA